MTEATADADLSDTQIRNLLKQVVDLLNNNDLLAAEATLDRVLAGRPNDADSFHLMGILRRMQGRADEAERLYRRAIALNPNLAQAHHNLGNLLRALGRHEE